MGSFSFKRELKYGGHVHSTLGETIQLVGDHVVLSYQNDIEGSEEVTRAKKKLRRVHTSDFSNDPDYNRDVQIVIDENYLNYILLNSFYNANAFSLSETLLQYWPENIVGMAPIMLRLFMTVSVWKSLFPQLVDSYDDKTQVDFRCGFNKDFLAEGKLHDDLISRVILKDHNKVDVDMHFGCTILALE